MAGAVVPEEVGAETGGAFEFIGLQAVVAARLDEKERQEEEHYYVLHAAINKKYYRGIEFL